MTGKEALEELIENAHEICEWELFRLHIIKYYLEVLEIIKKHYDKDSLITSSGEFIAFYIFNDDKDFNLIKEWLEHE